MIAASKLAEDPEQSCTCCGFFELTFEDTASEFQSDSSRPTRLIGHKSRLADSSLSLVFHVSDIDIKSLLWLSLSLSLTGSLPFSLALALSRVQCDTRDTLEALDMGKCDDQRGDIMRKTSGYQANIQANEHPF